MILCIQLLIAHIIGDFVIQTDKAVADKQQYKLRSRHLYLHVLMHGLLSLALMWTLQYWRGVVCIVLTHLIIDIWKLYAQNDHNRRTVFMVDQVMHILVIMGVAEFYTPWIQAVYGGIDSDQIMVLVLALLLVTIVGSHFIKVIISRWEPENEDNDQDSLTNAGSYIGILERLFVFGFIVSGNMQGIGFLLAAKSVFRFGDLKDAVDRKLTEYILIGTLLSFGLAILIGQVYLMVRLSL